MRQRKDRIVQRFKKCSHFLAKKMKRNEAIIFALSRSKEADTSNNIIPSLIPSEKIIHKFYITIIRTINSQNNQPVNKPEAKELFKEKRDCCFVTDDASAYAATRHQLRISNRSTFKTQRALQILAINYEPPVVGRRVNITTFWNQITIITWVIWFNFGQIIQMPTLASKMIDRLEKRGKSPSFYFLIYYILNIGSDGKTDGSRKRHLSDGENWRIEEEASINGINCRIMEEITLSEFNDFCVSTNELEFVACRIFGIYVNAASVERL
ncbi:hypothetical protein RCL_jg28397.t1 [Rhizophagus clarus]|uniref:Uncharacterized protein n=1 Tax=Rhizophagus clarus TaxID=94130 RepID=A0A8H3R021_9GLOM|nr:hypothetical protein RCL_jg28397.t1 [Rhizophagus clarus]